MRLVGTNHSLDVQVVPTNLSSPISARSYLLSVLEHGIKNGRLVVEEEDFACYTFGTSKDGKSATVVVKDERFWGKVLRYSVRHLLRTIQLTEPI